MKVYGEHNVLSEKSRSQNRIVNNIEMKRIFELENYALYRNITYKLVVYLIIFYFLNQHHLDLPPKNYYQANRHLLNKHD